MRVCIMYVFVSIAALNCVLTMGDVGGVDMVNAHQPVSRPHTALLRRAAFVNVIHKQPAIFPGYRLDFKAKTGLVRLDVNLHTSHVAPRGRARRLLCQQRAQLLGLVLHSKADGRGKGAELVNNLSGISQDCVIFFFEF